MAKLITLLFVLIIIFIYQTSRIYKNNTLSYQIPSVYEVNYFDKYTDVFCVQPYNYQLPEELVGAFRILNRASAVNPVQNCVFFQFNFLKNENKILNGYFEFNEESFSPNNLIITVDNLYEPKSDLTTAVLILHELSNVYETLKNQEIKKTPPCFQKEILAYLTQADFINTLSNKEKLQLFLDVFSKSLQDSRYEILRQVIWAELKAEIFCFYDEKCRKVNITKMVEEILKNNFLHQKYCPYPYQENEIIIDKNR